MTYIKTLISSHFNILHGVVTGNLGKKLKVKKTTSSGNVVHILVHGDSREGNSGQWENVLWHKPRVKEWLMVRVIRQEMMI